MREGREKLNPQELKNAIYTGPWLVEAKKWFSKTGCPAYDTAKDYLTGSPIRQDYLETALGWISSKDGIEIKDYMSTHQHDLNATELRLYFLSVINWVEATFTKRKELMKGLHWGVLYNRYHTTTYDPTLLEDRIVELIEDDEVNNKRGIYEFLLSKETNRSVLGLRTFNKKIIVKKYEQQNGVCPLCDPTKHYDIDEMEADHIIPWSRGGETTEENCRMLCMHHNRTKSNE